MAPLHDTGFHNRTRLAAEIGFVAVLIEAEKTEGPAVGEEARSEV
jgi:hypothetical protein